MSAYEWKWTARIKRGTLSSLQELAESLGFVAGGHNHLTGKAAPSKLLDALAAAYEADPGGVHLALKVIGVYNKPADATPPE